MKKVLIALSISAAALLASGHGAAWSYKGETGPAHWGKLDKNFFMCEKGQNQTPINIVGDYSVNLEKFTLNYGKKATKWFNNGHTVEVAFAPGNTLKIDGKTFELKQFHFHTPSENHINGVSYPMEAHFVHLSKDGKIAVLTVMFVEGKKNPYMQKLINKMPKKKGDSYDIRGLNLKPEGMLPTNLDKYYRFNGSLTTPPCSEGVRWMVLKQPVEMSRAQFATFEKVLDHNNRPLNPLNARKVLEK